MKYGFRELGERIREAAESYRGMLPSDGEVEAEDLLPDVDELVLAGEEIQDAKLKEGYVPASHVLSLADFKIALRGPSRYSSGRGGRYGLRRQQTRLRP